MRKPPSVTIFALTAAISLSNAYADGTMSFSYVAHETCIAGEPGTFTANGDVTNYYGMFSAYGSGVLNFDSNRDTASDINNDWDYAQIPPVQGTPNNGAPLGIFPQRTTFGSCFFNFNLKPDLSFTLDALSGRCTSTDTTGPYVGNTVTFSNSPQVKGQFSTDMQSFVAHRIGLGIENGRYAFGDGTLFERICMREFHGVRVRKDDGRR